MADTQRRRAVLLGASNLSMGAAAAVAEVRRVMGPGELDLLAAFGHGRSYGTRSRVLARTLPGIVDCGLWDQLLRREDLPTYALITDVGNDLGFGASPPQVAAWVRTCLERLHQVRARTVVTLLPSASLKRLRPWRFRLARALLFPSCQASLGELLRAVEELDRLLLEIAQGWPLHLVEPLPRWYGPDAIHLRPWRWREAWSSMLEPWGSAPPSPGRAGTCLGDWLRLRWMAPERRWLFGVERRRAQPAGTLAGGVRVWLF